MIEKVKNGLCEWIFKSFSNTYYFGSLVITRAKVRLKKHQTYLNTFDYTEAPSLAMLQENFGFIIEGMPHINQLFISFAAVFKVIIDVNE